MLPMFGLSKPALIEWTEPPQMETGAPEPAIIADDNGLLVAYRVRDDNVQGPEELFGRVFFETVLQSKFGYPNDEVLAGHPLYKYGLGAYAFYKITNSPWIAELQKMNSVHPKHSGGWASQYGHWIVTFHDETLEVIGQSARTLSSVRSKSASMVVKLGV